VPRPHAFSEGLTVSRKVDLELLCEPDDLVRRARVLFDDLFEHLGDRGGQPGGVPDRGR